ncbi:condensation domain-containing protein [Actinospica robiniae]|uniref:condensation domain-containing protein n=1 Tax=Actinospica robiniae TaxID=304901 RepID=UPI00041AFDC5|nr:condensation domain-containing protein [Actinospica robiniae]
MAERSAADGRPRAVPGDRVRELSVGQQALWLLHRTAPESSAYNDAGAVLFNPAPRPDVLERAVEALVGRHELLRSRFVDLEDRPVRVVHPAGPVRIEQRQVPGLDDVELVASARDLARSPFRLSDEEPFRVFVLHREQDAAVVVAAHHIATDAYSMHLIWRDLLEAYRAYDVESEPDWPELTGTYDDYVTRERQLLDSPRRAELAAYWRDLAAGGRAAALPTDRPRPASSAFDGGTCSSALSDEAAQRVREAAQSLRVTPFSLLFGVLHALLHRYTGENELLVGCPTTVRRSRSLRDMVGLLVNSIVVRSSWSEETTFAEAIGQVGGQLAAAMTRSGYPYALMGPAASAGEPLFRIAATMVTGLREQSAAQGAGGSGRIAGHRVTRLDVPHLEGQCDLTVEFTQDGDALAVVFRYDRELFDESTIGTLLQRYLNLLGAACADPARPVSRAVLTDPAERRRLALLGGRADAGPAEKSLFS